MGKYRNWLGWIVFLLLIYFPIFLHLDTLSLRNWDEARRGVNAFEAAVHGHWIVTYFDGAPDMWGTKPPLLIWLQALFMKMLGYNELAVRLPVALAALATVLLLVWFAEKILYNPLIGFLAGLILVTSDGFIESHGAISGDFDGLLMLWITVYSLAFWRFTQIHQPEERQVWWYTFIAALVLAALTKGVAAFFPLPALLLFTWQQRQFKPLLQSPHTYLGAAIVLVCVAGFYLTREWLNPGFLQAVWGNELGGRYMQPLEGQGQAWYYYIWYLWTQKPFFPWIYLVPVGLIISLWQPGRWRSLGIFLLLEIAVVLAILSFSATKIRWYVLPLFPPFALLAALPLGQAYLWLMQQLRIDRRTWWAQGLLLIWLGLWFILPYRQGVQKVYAFEHHGFLRDEHLYRDFMRRNDQVKHYTIVHPNYSGHVIFYRKVFNQNGYDIRSQPMYAFQTKEKVPFGSHLLHFVSGDTVMVCETAARDSFLHYYPARSIQEWDNCRLLVVE